MQSQLYIYTAENAPAHIHVYQHDSENEAVEYQYIFDKWAHSEKNRPRWA